MGGFDADTRGDIQELVRLASDAMSNFSCPFLQYSEGITTEFGTCYGGCYQAPACVTDDSVLGYLSTLKTCVSELIEIFEGKI